MKTIRRLFLQAAFAAWASGDDACAADIALKKLPSGKLAIFLDGEIVAGDAAKLASAKRTLDEMPPATEEHTLMLNSAGGNYPEALRMMDMLPGAFPIGTRVTAGAECYSACALLFMAGHSGGGSAGLFPDRKLHHLGRLGFHAPYLKRLPGTVPGEAVELSYKLAIDGIRVLLQKESVPPSLLTEFLAIGPSDTLKVDTVDRAGRWGVEVYGFRKRPISKKMLCTACMNHYRWRAGQSSFDPGCSAEDASEFAVSHESRSDDDEFPEGETAEDAGSNDVVVRGLLHFPRHQSTECRVLVSRKPISFVDDLDEDGPYALGNFGPPGTKIDISDINNFSIFHSEYYPGPTHLTDLGR